MGTKKVKLEDLKGSRGRTKKAELDRLSDADISENVLADMDSVVPTTEELGEFSQPKSRDKKNEEDC